MSLTKFAGALICSFFAVSQCVAEGVPDDIMINTGRCEAGRVAARMIRDGMPNDKKVVVSWTHTQTIKREGGVGLTFPFPLFNFGGSGDLSREEFNELRSEGQVFNLHPDNQAVCKGFQRRIIREGIGIGKCLLESKYASLRNSIEQKTGSASCKTKITLAKKISGNARVKFWGVDVGPSGSWGDIEVYEVAIAAPNAPKEK